MSNLPLLFREPLFDDDGLHLYFDGVEMLFRHPLTQETRVEIEVSRPIHVPRAARKELCEIINNWRSKKKLNNIERLDFLVSDYFFCQRGDSWYGKQ